MANGLLDLLGGLGQRGRQLGRAAGRRAGGLFDMLDTGLERGMDWAADNPILSAVGGDEGILASHRQRRFVESLPPEQQAIARAYPQLAAQMEFMRPQMEAEAAERERRARLEAEKFALDREEFEFEKTKPAAGRDQFRVLSAQEAQSRGLPPGSTYQLNLTTGRVEPVSGQREQDWSQGQRTGSSYIANMSDAFNRAVRIIEGGFDPRGVVAGRPRWTMSETGRDFYRAMRDYAEAELRSETGAAATQDEINRKLEQLFAGVNESEGNVGTILERMRTRIGSMAAAQGGAFEALYPDLTPREVPERFRQAAEAPADAGGAQTEGQPVQITSEAEYNALPSGAQYLDPNGVLRTKR